MWVDTKLIVKAVNLSVASRFQSHLINSILPKKAMEIVSCYNTFQDNAEEKFSKKYIRFFISGVF